MGIRNFAALTALSMAVATTPVFAQEGSARSFTMDGNWALDVGDDYCRLAANFANGDDVIAFALEKNRAENFARLVLVGEAIRPFRGSEAMGYSYLPDGAERSSRFLRSETGDNRPFFNLGNVIFGPDPFAAFAPGAGAPPAAAAPQDGPAQEFVIPPYDRDAELAFAAGVTGIALSTGLRDPIRIETGSLRAPVQALQACADDLLLVWGLDYEAHKTMTRRATPAEPAYEWLSSNTIGFRDFGLLGGGNNVVRVMVSAEGKPTECKIHWATLSERTNTAICDGIMENGKFTPARDAQGNAMASYWMVEPLFNLTRPFGR